MLTFKANCTQCMPCPSPLYIYSSIRMPLNGHFTEYSCQDSFAIKCQSNTRYIKLIKNREILHTITVLFFLILFFLLFYYNVFCRNFTQEIIC